MAKDFEYQIRKEIMTLSINSKYENSLQVVSWNGYEPKFDIREWDPDHEKMGKGMTLTDEELKKLKELLNGLQL